jgi:hypothetical protein
MQLLNPYNELLTGTPHYEGDVLTIPPGGNATFETEALRDQEYGIRRLLFNEEDFGRANVLSTLLVGRRETVWENVHLQTVQGIFDQSLYEPGLPITVPAGETFKLIVKNPTSQPLVVRVVADLMEPAVLRQRKENVRSYVGGLPRLKYAYAFSEIPPGTPNQLLDIEYPADRWVYDNFSFFPTATGPIDGSDVLVEQLVENEQVIEQTRGRGFLGFNENRRAPAPIPVGPYGPIQLRITNQSAETVIISALIPLIEADVLPQTTQN